MFICLKEKIDMINKNLFHKILATDDFNLAEALDKEKELYLHERTLHHVLCSILPSTSQICLKIASTEDKSLLSSLPNP